MVAPRKEVLGKPVTGLLVARTARPPGRTGPPQRPKGGRNASRPCPLPKGLILVSEAFTEINAGLVIVLASGHDPPVPPNVLATQTLTLTKQSVQSLKPIICM